MPSGTASIQSIVFHEDGGFDITYAEEQDINPKGTTIHQHMVPGGVVDITEVVDDIRELLDLALIARFNDPAERIVHHR